MIGRTFLFYSPSLNVSSYSADNRIQMTTTNQNPASNTLATRPAANGMSTKCSKKPASPQLLLFSDLSGLMLQPFSAPKTTTEVKIISGVNLQNPAKSPCQPYSVQEVKQFKKSVPVRASIHLQNLVNHHLAHFLDTGYWCVQIFDPAYELM